MSGLQIWWFTLVTVAFGASIIFGDDVPTGCPDYPDSPIMNDEFRHFILNLVNGYRSRIANGIHESMNGTNFPSGKNINKLSWDCRIEAAGREAAQTCFTQYSTDYTYQSYGQSFFVNGYESPQRAMELLITEFFKDYIDFVQVEGTETRLYSN